jgi:prolipoprotein diacylglyceryltransferase
MNFPVYLPIGPWLVHPHLVFEAFAYFVGFQLYLHLRRRRGDAIPYEQRWVLVGAAAAGAAVGSKALYWLVDPPATWSHLGDTAYLLGGKTVVGGLLGGWAAVELAKRALGVVRSSGDLFAAPMALAIAVGRIGCFLTGLSDRTYGNPTSLPWGVDFGDGIPRHPTQIYELAFCAGLAAFLLWRMGRPYREGSLWRAFAVGYLGWRLAVGFIQPGWTVAGLSSIQWACIAGLAVAIALLRPAERGVPA